MKKKVYTVILAISLLCTAVAGCGKANNEKKEDSKETVTEKKEDKEKKEVTEESGEKTEEKEEEAVENQQESVPAEAGTAAVTDGDWKTLAFTLDGNQITFPISYQEVKALGYAIDEEYESEEIESMHYTTALNAYGPDGKVIMLRFKNFSSETKTVADCDIYGFGIDNLAYMDVNPTFTLCNGVTFGDNEETIRAAMGEEPEFEHKSDDGSYSTLRYSVDSGNAYEKSKIEFTLENDKLTGVDITNGDL